MHVRFDKVEVIKLRRESNLVITRKIYQIDYFELKRQNKRRTKNQFHRSDLYREWVLVQKRIIDDDSDDEDDKHSEGHITDSIKEVYVGKSSIPEYFDRIANEKYRLAVDKIRKADQRRIRKQRRRRRRNQSNREPGRRGSCFSAIRKGSYSLL